MAYPARTAVLSDRHACLLTDPSSNAVLVELMPARNHILRRCRNPDGDVCRNEILLAGKV